MINYRKLRGTRCVYFCSVASCDRSWGFGTKIFYFSGPFQVRSGHHQGSGLEQIEGDPQLLIDYLQFFTS